MIILMFGATGSAGGSVLRVCLELAAVTEVRAIVRRPIGLADFKLREIVHADYLDFSAVAAAFVGVDACFYVKGADIGRAMLEATSQGIRNRVIENAELRDLADRWAGKAPPTERSEAHRTK